MAGVVALLAHAGDKVAHALADAWPGGRGRVLTPAALPAWGCDWRLDTAGRAASGGPALSGVLTLLDAVHPADLPHVAPKDRDYVCGETSAFLLAWLHALSCRKLNPPSLAALDGTLRQVVWRAHALRCGLRVPCLHVGADPPDGDIALTVVGRRVLGRSAPDGVTAALALSLSARLPLISVTLRRDAGQLTLCHASARADLTDPAVAAAVFDWFAEVGS